jgi:hypothetical protein
MLEPMHLLALQIALAILEFSRCLHRHEPASGTQTEA